MHFVSHHFFNAISGYISNHLWGTLYVQLFLHRTNTGQLELSLPSEHRAVICRQEKSWLAGNRSFFVSAVTGRIRKYAM